MKQVLNKLYTHEGLNEIEAHEVLTKMGKGEYNNSQIASFLTVYLMRPIRIEELRGFQQALLDLSLPINFNGKQTIDVCGTGGDGKDTFNISTLAAMVVAGAGYKVSKHGNYGVSSVCGSSNVLEYLGYTFSNDEAQLNRQLDKANFCMMHAPLFHPAMKHVAPIRKELGVKTFFNMLGPLVNPSRPSHQLVGVFNLELARIYHYLFQEEEKNFSIVHSLDGYDEVSLTGHLKLISNKEEEVIDPHAFGFDILKQNEIYGGSTIEEAAKIFTTILETNGTAAQNAVVLSNAALAIRCFEYSKSLEECVAIATESLKSKRALEVLQIVVNS